MPRGLPDYYNPDTLVSQRLANVEEIVTHQRGIASLDNRGRTLLFTNFKDGVADWEKLTTGDGSAPASSTAEALVAPNSMLLDAGTDSGAGYSRARKFINVRDVKKAGLECSFQYRSTLAKFDMALNYDNGVDQIQGAIRIDRVAKVIQIMDDTVPTTVISLPTAPTAAVWFPVKLVIDFENQVYERLLLGLKQIDISSYDLELINTSHSGLIRAKFIADALDDGTNYAYIGHAAITIDEP